MAARKRVLAPVTAATTARTLSAPKLKADAATLVITADKEGKLRILTSSWVEPHVMLKGHEIVLRNVGGQLHLYDVEAK